MARRSKPDPANPSLPLHGNLEDLKKAAKNCQACDLWKRGTQTVFGEGAPNAKIMFVGEQPGDQEDLEGRPFVGPAGKLLDRALVDAGIDKRLSGRSALKTDAKRQVRHAMEIRHNSFVTPAFIELLRTYDVALVCADTVEWPRLMDITSDFIYCRLHGSEQLYASGYDGEALDQWAARVASWAQGKEPPDAEQISKPRESQMQPRDVFIYFDNDAKVRAPFDAQGLMARVNAII